MSRPKPWDAETRIRQQHMVRMVATSVTRCGRITPPPTRETGMSEAKQAHTPGKICVGNTRKQIVDSRLGDWWHVEVCVGRWPRAGNVIAMVGMGDEAATRKERDGVEANAERLVACWNACESLPDPSVVPELVEVCRKLVAAHEDGGMYFLPRAMQAAGRASAVLAKIDGK